MFATIIRATRMQFTKDANIVTSPTLLRIGDRSYRQTHDSGEKVVNDQTKALESALGRMPRNSSDSKPKAKLPVLPRKQVSMLTEQDKKQVYMIDELEAKSFADNQADETAMDIELGDEEIMFKADDDQILRMHVAASFIGFIATNVKTCLESVLGVQLRLPPPPAYNKNRRDKSNDNANNFIEITGPRKSALITARTQLQHTIKELRNRNRVTHFPSIPLSLDQNFQQKYIQFKAAIMEDEECGPTIDQRMFQPEGKCHLTIRVLHLADGYEHKAATKLLRKLKSVLETEFECGQQHRPIELHVKGLDIMNDDPTAVHVLYGKAKTQSVEHEERFRKILNHIYDQFEEFGIRDNAPNIDANGQEWKMKVHCTLLNTRHAMSDRSKKRHHFDATKILHKYGDFDFGVVPLREIHVSTISSTDGNTKYYLPLAKIEF